MFVTLRVKLETFEVVYLNRHFDWDPQAQHSPSIDIYRRQSALPRWPPFEIYCELPLR
jgi:hypothetical protein